MDYPLRARYRDGFEQQTLLVPGQPTRLHWKIGSTSLILNRGHRLRLTVSNTGAPLYEPNSQTGGPQTADWLQTAISGTHSILHEKSHASRLWIPLIKTTRRLAQP
jgi:predicted acyl esterase